MKSWAYLLWVLVLTFNAANAQTIIYTRDKNGKSRLEVPTNNNESPSVVFNSDSNVIALGGAAKIIAQGSQNRNATSAVVLKKQALWSQGEYVGSLTEISNRIYITAAHVLNKLNEQELSLKLKQLGLSERTQILQPYNQGKFLDIVILSDLGLDQVQKTLSSLIGSHSLKAGEIFSLSHLVLLDSRLVEQKSQGVISLSEDSETLYLMTGLDSFLTWGSSGSVVLNTSDENTPLAGIVQCVVKTNVASSNTISSRSYFRAISSSQLVSVDLIPSKLTDLSSRTADYELEKCGPVSGKDGGG